MKTIALLQGLQIYVGLLRTIVDEAIGANPAKVFNSTISLSYSQIELEIFSTTSGDTNAKALYFQTNFQIANEKVALLSVFCEDKSAEQKIKDLIEQRKPRSGYSWQPAEASSLYDKNIIQYLALADDIAREGYLCTSGDGYHPGYYSEIVVTDEQLVLRQINLHNSRSINHKQDYHMRKLEFFIPLLANSRPTTDRLDVYQIGNMIVRFEDHSSKNNKTCGDRIRAKIVETLKNQ